MDPYQEMLDLFMTTDEISQTYRINSATVRIAIDRGYVKAYKVGKTWLIPRAEADQRWAPVLEAKLRQETYGAP